MILRYGPWVITVLAVTGVVAYLVAWWADPVR